MYVVLCMIEMTNSFVRRASSATFFNAFVWYQSISFYLNLYSVCYSKYLTLIPLSPRENKPAQEARNDSVGLFWSRKSLLLRPASGLMGFCHMTFAAFAPLTLLNSIKSFEAKRHFFLQLSWWHASFVDRSCLGKTPMNWDMNLHKQVWSQDLEHSDSNILQTSKHPPHQTNSKRWGRLEYWKYYPELTHTKCRNKDCHFLDLPLAFHCNPPKLRHFPKYLFDWVSSVQLTLCGSIVEQHEGATSDKRKVQPKALQSSPKPDLAEALKAGRGQASACQDLSLRLMSQPTVFPNLTFSYRSISYPKKWG